MESTATNFSLTLDWQPNWTISTLFYKGLIRFKASNNIINDPLTTYGGSRIHHGTQRIQEMFKGSRVSSGYLPNGLTYECNMFGFQAST